MLVALLVVLPGHIQAIPDLIKIPPDPVQVLPGSYQGSTWSRQNPTRILFCAVLNSLKNCKTLKNCQEFQYFIQNLEIFAWAPFDLKLILGPKKFVEFVLLRNENLFFQLNALLPASYSLEITSDLLEKNSPEVSRYALDMLNSKLIQNPTPFTKENVLYKKNLILDLMTQGSDLVDPLRFRPPSTLDSLRF